MLTAAPFALVAQALLQEVEQLREQAAYDADALATAQYEHEVLQARVQVCALSPLALFLKLD